MAFFSCKVLLLLLLSSSRSQLVASIFFPFNNRDTPTCDDCICIPNDGEECPTDLAIIQDDVTFEQLFNLNTIKVQNPIELDCDPYIDESCDTSPPLAEDGVCAVQIIPDSSRRTFLDFLFGRDLSCPSQYTYQLETFDSFEEAESNGFIVTHDGPCGTCSTLQDLTVYLKYPDLVTIGTTCGAAGLVDFEAGIKCWMAFGFTRSCASIWIFNTINTNKECGDICIAKTLTGAPNNGPPPTCDLDPCLQCDEDESVPLFKKFAGRTRRRSGILSGIVRKCDELIDGIPILDPCSV